MNTGLAKISEAEARYWDGMARYFERQLYPGASHSAQVCRKEAAKIRARVVAKKRATKATRSAGTQPQAFAHARRLREGGAFAHASVERA